MKHSGLPLPDLAPFSFLPSFPSLCLGFLHLFLLPSWMISPFPCQLYRPPPPHHAVSGMLPSFHPYWSQHHPPRQEQSGDRWDDEPHMKQRFWSTGMPEWQKWHAMPREHSPFAQSRHGLAHVDVGLDSRAAMGSTTVEPAGGTDWDVVNC